MFQKSRLLSETKNQGKQRAALRSFAELVFDILRPQIISLATLAVTAEHNVWRPVQLTQSIIQPLAFQTVQGNYSSPGLVRAKRMTEPSSKWYWSGWVGVAVTTETFKWNYWEMGNTRTCNQFPALPTSITGHIPKTIIGHFPPKQENRKQIICIILGGTIVPNYHLKLFILHIGHAAWLENCASVTTDECHVPRSRCECFSETPRTASAARFRWIDTV